MIPHDADHPGRSEIASNGCAQVGSQLTSLAADAMTGDAALLAKELLTPPGIAWHRLRGGGEAHGEEPSGKHKSRTGIVTYIVQRAAITT